MRLALKELRETLRDRRTIATLLLMPLLVYPLLSVAFERFLLSNVTSFAGRTDYVLGLRNEAEADHLARYVYLGTAVLTQRRTSEQWPGEGPAIQRQTGERRPDEGKRTERKGPEPKQKLGATRTGATPATRSPDPSPPTPLPEGEGSKNPLPQGEGGRRPGEGPAASAPKNKRAAKKSSGSGPAFLPVMYELVGNPRQAVLEGRVDVAVTINKTDRFPADMTIERAIDCELFYDAQIPRSREAFNWLEGCLSAVNEQSLAHQLKAKGVKSRLSPVRLEAHSIEAEGDNRRPGTPSLATLVPLILILMTITGAVYPAIDLTAGERERGTLETLIASPVPRMQLLLAKYAAVVTVALLTAVVNLAAMLLTVSSIGLGTLLFGEAGVSYETLLEIVALLVLFAAFFSAVLLAVTSFARSFKEGRPT